jgi:positive phototaxis protein PixI
MSLSRLPESNLFVPSSPSQANMPNSALTLPQNLPQNRQQKAVGDAYLKFRLGQQTPAVFSMKHVQEALILPVHRLTPMPNMPACMLGLMNRRSRVMWVIDLAQLLGLPVLDTSTRQYSLVIVRVGSIPLGLGVQKVEGVAWLTAESVQPPPGQAPSSLLPYLRGCVVQQKEILLVLNAEAVVQSSVLHS